MYKITQPFSCGFLLVGDGNEMYWETTGNPKGIPVLHLHGGPGGGLSRNYTQHFNHEKYLIVGFEQRGCGRSRPQAHIDLSKLSSNTTPNLIADIELLRTHLKIESWFLYGSSWGTTLALAYAEAYPNRTQGLVLAAVTMTSAEEVDWVTEKMQKLFPREGEELFAAANPNLSERLIDACYRKVTDINPEVRLVMARAWCAWEDTHMSLDPDFKPFLSIQSNDFCLLFATLVLHYWSHSAFIPEGSILRNLHQISHIPCVLIHGRLDVSSPLEVPWSIHKKWPSSELFVTPNGHGGLEMAAEVTKAFDKIF